MSVTTPNAVPNVPAASRRNFQIVALAVLLYIVLDIIAQLLPPHYSAITQAESDLAVGPYGFVMTLNFVNRGLLSLLFLAAFVTAIKANGTPWREYRVGIALLSVWGVGALLLAAFPTDVPSTPVSWHGAIHLVVALLAFLGGAFGIYFLAAHFGESRLLAPARWWALPLAAISIVLCLVELAAGFVVPHLAARVGGLTERVFLGSVFAWIFCVALYLARYRSSDPTASA